MVELQVFLTVAVRFVDKFESVWAFAFVSSIGVSAHFIAAIFPTIFTLVNVAARPVIAVQLKALVAMTFVTAEIIVALLSTTFAFFQTLVNVMASIVCTFRCSVLASAVIRSASVHANLVCSTSYPSTLINIFARSCRLIESETPIASFKLAFKEPFSVDAFLADRTRRSRCAFVDV